MQFEFSQINTSLVAVSPLTILRHLRTVVIAHKWLALANSFGKPAVAMTVGGIPEMIKHGKTSLLVPPRDAHILSDAMVTLLQNDILQQEMRQHALHQSHTVLSWANIARRTMSFYDHALTAHAARYQAALPVRGTQ